MCLCNSELNSGNEIFQKIFSKNPSTFIKYDDERNKKQTLAHFALLSDESKGGKGKGVQRFECFQCCTKVSKCVLYI